MTGVRDTVKNDMDREGVNGPEALAMVLLALFGVGCMLSLIRAAIDNDRWLFVLALAAFALVIMLLLAIGSRVDTRSYQKDWERKQFETALTRPFSIDPRDDLGERL